MKIEKQNPGFAKRVKSWLTGKYVENGSTASQNIPAGKWVTWKGQVCKAKTAITAGDTLSSSNLDTTEDGMINALEGKDRNTKSNTAVNIIGYTSSSNEYTCPSDGYVRYWGNGSLYSGTIQLCQQTNQGSTQTLSLFVVKGMKVHCVGSFSNVAFFPLYEY